MLKVIKNQNESFLSQALFIKLDSTGRETHADFYIKDPAQLRLF